MSIVFVECIVCLCHCVFARQLELAFHAEFCGCSYDVGLLGAELRRDVVASASNIYYSNFALFMIVRSSVYLVPACIHTSAGTSAAVVDIPSVLHYAAYVSPVSVIALLRRVIV